jgi:SAM-dependent methyltransferase
MSTVDKRGDAASLRGAPAPPPPPYLDARGTLAFHFLAGEGLEIGALHQPLTMPPHAQARYVDRMTTPELRKEYPELAAWDLVEVDVVDDGETLATVAAESQDFIVANHFLEHTENPIGTIETHLGKLKPGGVLFYAVPDKRYTFDFRRPVTPIEHMAEDYENGPEGSRNQHYREWASLVIDEESPSVGTAEQAASPEWVEEKARALEDTGYSIHMHVWTQAEFLGLMLACRERFGEGFDIEATARSAIEYIVVLRKAGGFPAPAAPPPPAPNPDDPPDERWRARIRRALGSARRELRGGKVRS